MIKKIKKIIKKLDKFLFKKFGSDKGTKFLENIKEAEIIFSLLNEVGKESNIKFVGGCVRKSLTGDSIDDIDFATLLEPKEVKAKLKKSNIKVIDTGIDHGTVTAFVNGKKFEITTLRKDIVTDGRHAKVDYTLNWYEDSSRRDFTINSIYADSEGRVFDLQNGVSDLKNGKVRFIGSPEIRIKEDYLRILRYLRFFIQYSKEEHDKETIVSIKKNINGLNKISKERIFDELKKIFNLKNFDNLFSNEQSKDLFLNIFPQLKHHERLKAIRELNQNTQEKYDNDLILGLLIIDKSNDYEYFCHKYKTSNSIKDRFKFIYENFEDSQNKNFYSEENIKKLIYLSSKSNVKDLLLFLISSDKKANILIVEKLLKYVDGCKIPKFPISGEHLKKYGYVAGKELGKKLKSLEEKWIENNFVVTKQIFEKFLEKNN